MRYMMTLMAAIAFSSQAIAQTSAPPPPSPTAPSPTPIEAAPELRTRVDGLTDILSGKGDYDAYFAAAFRAQIPKATFDQVNAQLLAANGPLIGIEGFEARTAWSGLVTMQYRDVIATIGITVDQAAPHQVIGLRILGSTVRESTLDAVVTTIKSLPGQTGFVLAKLGDKAPQPVFQHNGDTPLAIGSAFKLVILSELIRATNAGERKWDDVITLDGKELPGGGYTQKPAGTTVTLRELATQMISISDNSATDILLTALGRKKVEAMMPVIGIKNPARNRPFLGTAEFFKLKGVGKGALAARYLSLNEAGRRAMLDSEIAATPFSAMDPALFKDGKPILIDRLEWFESANDLVRVMDWVRRNTEGPKGADARTILSKNSGIPPMVASKWQFVGYKGGSEPGVMTMALLLQARNGEWYAVVGSWNDPAQDVGQGRFAGLISKAAELALPAP
ncbi:serine hydrolase [Sphingomonas sp. 28-62-11]|uniref:serine hydrolase n=1 Tax=Sphingomonas sp. 28-62-11 TaxID=1970432 RepID=UPI000BCC188B|nr:MAG: hypothetical protein B7Y49_02815 [Sphingomonas sp. 28-62-11]